MNKTYWNRVNFRRFVDRCAGKTYWKVESFNAFFSDPVDSVAQTWNKHRVSYSNYDFTKGSATSYTKEGGVTLAGILNLNAQAGYDSGTSYMVKVRKKSWICANDNTGIVQDRAILVKKRS